MSDCIFPHPDAHMNESTKVFLSALLITGAVVFLTTAGATLFLYRTAVEEQKGRLLEYVTNQARLIALVHEETVDRDQVRPASEGESCSRGLAAILAKLSSTFQEDRSLSVGMRPVLNFFIAERQGEWVRYHQGTDKLVEQGAPFAKVQNSPMGLALQGGTDVLQTVDHMGNPILCAYTGIPSIQLGLVAKILIADLKRPFVTMGWITFACALFLLLLAGLAMRKVVSPLVSTMEQQREELQEKNEVLLVRATTDTLTGLFNRQYFNERLQHGVSCSARYELPVSLIMFDIDRFKEINDRFGHLAGDAVLCELAELVRTNIRGSDIFARWGGDEFIILTFKTDKELAGNIATKLCTLIAGQELTVGRDVTCSFGVATFRPGEPVTELISRVDAALYKAKQEGRNRAVVL